VCEDFNWAIAPGADDLRMTALRDGYSEQPKLRTTKPRSSKRSKDVVSIEDPSKPEPEPVWLAKSLPSGTLFQLLTRPECRICLLVLHLISPLPIKSLLSWSLDQPLSVLQGLCYTMQYETGEVIVVKTRQPGGGSWQNAGTIEMIKEEVLKTKNLFSALGSDEIIKEEKQDADEQSIVWASSKLSRRRRLNSSWIQTTEVDYSLAKYWLRRCNEYHEHCHISRAHGRRDMDIRLIDVVDQCIVPGTLAHRYLALSYVWGGVERLRATKENIVALEQKDALRVRSASLPRT
jgi:hypothetical protein